MTTWDPGIVERAAGIRLLVLDVDGVLTDGRLYFDHHGNELKGFHTRDGFGIRALDRYGIPTALITGRESGAVTHRAAQLKIEHVYQGRFDKLNAYRDLLAKTGREDHQVCYVGDDLVDLPLLRRVRLAVAVPGAVAAVREQAHWVTTASGGHGAVREVCELILSSQGLDQKLLTEILDL